MFCNCSPNVQLTFPDIKSILLNCLPRPRIGALHILQVISGFGNAPDLIEIDLKKANYFYQLHADGIVSRDLDFEMQFGNRLSARTCLNRAISRSRYDLMETRL